MLMCAHVQTDVLPYRPLPVLACVVNESTASTMPVSKFAVLPYRPNLRRPVFFLLGEASGRNLFCRNCAPADAAQQHGERHFIQGLPRFIQ